MLSDPSSQPAQPLTDAQYAAASVLIVEMGSPLSWGPEVNELADVGRLLLAEVDRLRAENTAMREARDGECPRCRFPVWSHDLWKCIPWDMGKHVGDDELRREVVLRELNQGALAGISSEVTDQAADLVLAALNRYDAWRAEPDPRALGLDQDGRGQANAN